MDKWSKLIHSIDWDILAVVCGIIVIGLLSLYSATYVQNISIFLKQILWVFLGFFVMLVLFMVDYRDLMRLAWPIYGLTVILLVLVLVIGTEAGGAKRWLSLGFFGVQPSEIAKVMVIIWAGFYGAKREQAEPYGLQDLLFFALILSVPVILTLLEPDLGTAGIIVLIATGTIFVVGMKKSTILATTVAAIGILPVLWFSLKGYQRQRIFSFLDPSSDPLGSGYHALQSKIAVGSGGLFGKGFLHGTQTQLMFLPEHHTDFIFSVVAEEWGFMGSFILMLLYTVLATKIVFIGSKAKDKFGALLCFGIAIYFSLHVFINIGMAIGILPVVGVPLPFISYGGSFMMINMACIGIVLSVSWRRFIF